MKRQSFLIFAFSLALLQVTNAQVATNKLADYVNPFIGTGSYDANSLSGNNFPGATTPFGLVLKGFIISEAKHWNCAAFASKNITYRNLKIVSDNAVDDGIDIVGSKNVLVQNSVMWNGARGNGLEIGFETRSDSIQNVIFRNCDLIHVEGPEGTFTIHYGDRVVVKNVLYEDIRVEDSRGWLIDFIILKSRYSKDTVSGKIEDVCFKNITIEGNQFPYSQIMGFDEEPNADGLTFENFNMHGIKVNSTYNRMITTSHTNNLIFK